MWRALSVLNHIVWWTSLIVLVVIFTLGVLGIADFALPGSPLGLERLTKHIDPGWMVH